MLGSGAKSPDQVLVNNQLLKLQGKYETRIYCVSCTSHKSWTGFPCRWCPVDGNCHPYDAIITNPCRISQNIVNKERVPT